MNIAVFLFEIPIMCLICLSPPKQVLQRQFILILFVVCKNLGRAWSKSHKINHPQLIQLVMLGVAHSGARAGARGGMGHQPISTVLNVAMNHVMCALDRVTNHVDHISVIYSAETWIAGDHEVVCGSPLLQSLNVAILQIVCQVYW